jgi:light-regulated signal transduction histidine kinase (bacteriophytochrome)
MNYLLKRQLRKYLSKEISNLDELQPFIEAIEKSYSNYESQFNRLQHAMSISSEELFEANSKLKIESNYQKEIIHKLKSVLETLDHNEVSEGSIKTDDSEDFKLKDFIETQTSRIIEINKQKEELLNYLEHQNQELSDYAHVVSHDLKSPLRNIETLISWLNEDLKNKLTNDEKQNIFLIRDNIEKMDTLINSVLEYTAIGKVSEEFHEVDVNEVVKDVIQIINLDLSIKVKEGLPFLYGSKYRFTQIFQNLIENAIKYNRKSKKTVEIGSIEKGDFHEFYVKDNGNGIDEKYYDKIFKSFLKLDNSQNSSGIGLSIVKKIVSLYDGEVWLESEYGKGTTFYFTIKKD